MTAEEHIEALSELERLKAEGKYIDLTNRKPDFTDCRCCEIREHCKDKEKYDEYLTCEELYELVKKEDENE